MSADLDVAVDAVTAALALLHAEPGSPAVRTAPPAATTRRGWDR
jgi:hypothetical protein